MISFWIFVIFRTSKASISTSLTAASEIIPVLSTQPLSEKARDTLQKVKDFLKEEVFPNERVSSMIIITYLSFHFIFIPFFFMVSHLWSWIRVADYDYLSNVVILSYYDNKAFKMSENCFCLASWTVLSLPAFGVTFDLNLSNWLWECQKWTKAKIIELLIDWYLIISLIG